MLKSVKVPLLIIMLTVASFAVPITVAAASVPILNFDEDISEWSLAGGFFYLTDTCTDFSIQTKAYIQRRVIYSTLFATLQTIDGRPQCRTFRHADTDESGIYYYNRNLGRLEAIYSDRPLDPPTTLATIGDWGRIGTGDGISTLRVHGSFVYWIESISNGELDPDDISIKRVPKTGGVVKTLISYDTASRASFEGLGITNSYIWWTDSDGLNRIDSCLFSPCLPGPVTKEVEFPLAANDGHIEISGTTVYWWTGNENPERIRRTSCSRISGNCTTSILHSTTSNTQLVGLSANSTAAWWVENITPGGNRLRRKAISGGIAETLEEGIHRATPYLDVDGVYFQTDIDTISRLSLNAQPITREIVINAWEVTQGLQRPVNDVPLVAGKTTYVRLYPTLVDGEDAGAVSAELHGSRDGQALPGSPVYPLNVSISVSSGMTLADRQEVDGGWLFRLPESWTRTGTGLIPQLDTVLTLRAVVDPLGSYADTDNAGNNEIEDDFLFTAKAPTCIRMRPVSTHGEYQSADGINVGQVVALTEASLPTANLITFPSDDALRETDWCWKGLVFGPFCSTPYELNDDDSLLLTKMGWLDYWAGSPEICRLNNARTLYSGIIHQDAEWRPDGMAKRDKDQLITKVPKYGESITRKNGLAMIMVHEVGHNYDRRHVDCGDPAPLRPDPDYPYPTSLIDFDLSLNHSELHFGFDPMLQVPINPGTTADYMTYCGPDWYSDYTWKAIFNNTRAPVFVPQPFQQQATGEQVRVAGVVDVTAGNGFLDFAWTLPSDMSIATQQQVLPNAQDTVRLSSAGNTPYHLQLISNGGTVLADQPVELSVTEDGLEGEPLPFDLLLEAPATTVGQLRLMLDNQVLATLEPGTGVPVVSLSEPAAGTNIENEITISWSASDPDGDDLLFTILYSQDGGGQWTPLLANFGGAGVPIESVTLDLSSESGSLGLNALVRVLASDGYNTAFATSEPFSVTPRAPFVSIAQPREDQVFEAQQTIALQGYAGDPEDGLIANSQYAWSTGHVGRFAEVRGLPPGPHAVELLVADSDAQEGISSVTFTIAPLAVPESSDAYLLDGRCDEGGYRDAPRLTLTPYSGGARATARINHTNGHLWLCLSGLQGTGGYAGLLLDSDNSRDVSVQGDDFGYFVARDGTRFVSAGNGVDFDSAAPDLLSARIFDYQAAWSAELRISKSAFGDWRRRVSLAIGHFGQAGNISNRWPLSTVLTSPQSWALTNFGLTGAPTGLVPDNSILGSGDINLLVTGSGFDADNRVLWNGTKVPTTLVDAETLSAIVPSGLAPSAGIQGVSVGLESTAGLTTAELPFSVLNSQPVIISLAPESSKPGVSGMTLDINGSDFIVGARVIWNGEERETTYVDSSLLRIELSTEDLQSEILIPVTVLNPEPQAAPSATVFFNIAQPEEIIFKDGFEF